MADHRQGVGVRRRRRVLPLAHGARRGAPSARARRRGRIAGGLAGRYASASSVPATAVSASLRHPAAVPRLSAAPRPSAAKAPTRLTSNVGGGPSRPPALRPASSPSRVTDGPPSSWRGWLGSARRGARGGAAHQGRRQRRHAKGAWGGGCNEAKGRRGTTITGVAEQRAADVGELQAQGLPSLC